MNISVQQNKVVTYGRGKTNKFYSSKNITTVDDIDTNVED